MHLLGAFRSKLPAVNITLVRIEPLVDGLPGAAGETAAVAVQAGGGGEDGGAVLLVRGRGHGGGAEGRQGESGGEGQDAPLARLRRAVVGLGLRSQSRGGEELRVGCCGRRDDIGSGSIGRSPLTLAVAVLLLATVLPPAVALCSVAAASSAVLLARPPAAAAGTFGSAGTLYAPLALRGGDGIGPVLALPLAPPSAGLPGAAATAAPSSAAATARLVAGLAGGGLIAAAGTVIVIAVARHVLVLVASASPAAPATAPASPATTATATVGAAAGLAAAVIVIVVALHVLVLVASAAAAPAAAPASPPPMSSTAATATTAAAAARRRAPAAASRSGGSGFGTGMVWRGGRRGLGLGASFALSFVVGHINNIAGGKLSKTSLCIYRLADRDEYRCWVVQLSLLQLLDQCRRNEEYAWSRRQRGGKFVVAKFILIISQPAASTCLVLVSRTSRPKII